jgi:hypothetical protein
MSDKEFVEKLKKFADDTGANITVNLRNSKGSPLSNCKIDKLDGALLSSCRLEFATIIPKQVPVNEKIGTSYFKGEK